MVWAGKLAALAVKQLVVALYAVESTFVAQLLGTTSPLRKYGTPGGVDLVESRNPNHQNLPPGDEGDTLSKTGINEAKFDSQKALAASKVMVALLVMYSYPEAACSTQQKAAVDPISASGVTTVAWTKKTDSSPPLVAR